MITILVERFVRARVRMGARACENMCVCVRACENVCVYACVRVRMYVCMRACV